MASKEGQQCGLLWRASLGFELSHGRSEAARKVFLRGIHACPWSKVRCLKMVLGLFAWRFVILRFIQRHFPRRRSL